MDARPIAIFDSGLGGVSVLREALELMPTENFIYYGDDGHAPYGDKTTEEITKYSLSVCRRLLRLNMKALIVACNTATANCISMIRFSVNVPVVSVEPAIKPACRTGGAGYVLMMATRATTHLPRYLALARSMPRPERILNVSCPGLVERIEDGVSGIGAFDDLLDSYLEPIHERQVDAIVLGCTHYVLIKEEIYTYAKAHFRGQCNMFDGGAATVRHLKQVLEEMSLLNDRGTGTVDYRTTGSIDKLLPIFHSFLYRP